MAREIPHELQAYAKIVGTGWEYYMVKPRIVLGRGGVDADCDVVLSSESAVSRRHFAIRFAPEHQAIEVENFSKNGILVNGEFVPRLSAPVLLRSQAEIAYGKFDFMRVTLILPASRRTGTQFGKRPKVPAVVAPTVDLTQGGGVAVEVAPGRYSNGSTVGRLPDGGQGGGAAVGACAHAVDGDGDVDMGTGGDAQVTTGKGTDDTPPFLPLLQWVGELLASDAPLTPAEISSRVRAKHRQQLGRMSDVAFKNSVRHVLMQNDHLFYVVDPGVDYGAARERTGGGGGGEGSVAKFALRQEEKGRFIQLAQASHATQNGGTV